MLPLFGVKKGVKMKKNMVFARFVRTAAWVLGCGALTPMAMASTVNVNLDEEHQVIKIKVTDEFGDHEHKYMYSVKDGMLYFDGGVAYDGDGYLFSRY